MLLIVQDFEKWLRTIDAIPEWEVTAKEKLLARHLEPVLDWCNEIATQDADYWGEHVKYYPHVLVTRTGMHKKTIARIMKRWETAGLIVRKTESNMDRAGQWHTSSFVSTTERFQQGDIRIGREKPDKGGIKKGHVFKMCPHCGKRLSKKYVVYQCESGHEITEYKNESEQVRSCQTVE